LQITALPYFIGKLIALTELIVCHNSMLSLPQTIVNLRNLEVLVASNNYLLYLPGSITNMQLKILDISKNDFFTSNTICIHTQRLMPLRRLAARVLLKNRFVSFTFFLLSAYVACASYCSKYNTVEIIIFSIDQYMTNYKRSTYHSRISKKRNIVFIARSPALNLT